MFRAIMTENMFPLSVHYQFYFAGFICLGMKYCIAGLSQHNPLLSTKTKVNKLLFSCPSSSTIRSRLPGFSRPADRKQYHHSEHQKKTSIGNPAGLVKNAGCIRFKMVCPHEPCPRFINRHPVKDKRKCTQLSLISKRIGNILCSNPCPKKHKGNARSHMTIKDID